MNGRKRMHEKRCSGGVLQALAGAWRGEGWGRSEKGVGRIRNERGGSRKSRQKVISKRKQKQLHVRVRIMKEQVARR